MSPDPYTMRIPTDDTKIRIVSEEGHRDVDEWCRECHKNAVPATGWKRRQLKRYLRLCSDINYWRIGDPRGFIKVTAVIPESDVLAT
ncbi:hypothetical protein APHAL10511_006952 [Amanita phalloides]|nr:hypothetical protein APHAL10511_006952 [Amanita phalloides]